jgi:hypothetical protein
LTSVPSSSFDVDILPAEGYSYVLVDPGVFKDIEELSFGKVLELELEEDGSDNVECERMLIPLTMRCFGVRLSVV